MPEDTKYNGWTNFETWQANLWLGDSHGDEDEEVLSEDAIKEEVAEIAGEHDGLLGDIVNGWLSSVDYRDLARSWNEGKTCEHGKKYENCDELHD